MASPWAAPSETRAAPAAARTQQLIDFTIEAAPLGMAVRSFALKAGVSVSYEPATVRGKTSRGVVGRFSAVAGLARLLEGTAIVALEQGNGDFVLRPAEQSDGMMPGERRAENAGAALPTIQVQGGTPSPFLVQASAAAKLTADGLDTPRSLSIIPAEVIREANAVTLVDALRTVPGVTFRGADALGAPAGDRPFIRGFDAANSVFVDGLRSSGPQGRELFAVEQVEVIEGPESVYNGRSTGGGNINLVSKTARMENFAETSTGVGSSGYRRQTVDVNRVLADDIAARINLMWQESSKAGREQVVDRRWGVAPTITFGATSPTRLTLGYYHLQGDDVPDYSVPYARGGGTPIGGGDTPFYGLLARDYLRTSTDIVQADFRQRLDGGLNLRNLTQYSRTRQSFVATNPQWSGTGGEVLSLQAKNGMFDIDTVVNQTELRGAFASPWGGHEWVAGLELSRENGMRDAYDIRDKAGNNLTAGASCAVAFNCTSTTGWDAGAPWTGSVNPSSGQMRVSTETEAAAAYLLDTLRLNDTWLIHAGVRYDYFNTRTDGAARLANREGTFNYQAGLVYKPLPNVSVYAAFSTSTNPVGADAGTGADTISVANQNLYPERVRNLEAGVKVENRAQTLAATVALFRAVKRDARISVSRDAITGATQSLRGIEAGLRGNLTPDWKVFGGISLLDSVIDDGGSSPAYSGNDFPMTPHRAFSLWTSYRLAAGWLAGAGMNYSDRIYANASNTNYVPAYTKFDAMVAYTVSSRLELQLNVYNLADKRYFDVAYPVYAAIAPRRSAVLSARLKF